MVVLYMNVVATPHPEKYKGTYGKPSMFESVTHVQTFGGRTKSG